MSYSQGDEEKIILNYFGNHKGTLLDIGANDGKTLSNSLALLEREWSGVLVEPDEDAFSKLRLFHQDSKGVLCYNFAIATQDGQLPFYKSGTHLNKGDTGLLSTFSIPDYEKWKPSTDYTMTEAQAVMFKTFQSICPFKIFDFITIDAEGMDYEILKQMDLANLGCKLLCVEFNGEDQARFDSYVKQFAMKLIYKNAQNLIYAK
jgi:FkbM family methyltransferase